MKEFNCPDCVVEQETCAGCQRMKFAQAVKGRVEKNKEKSEIEKIKGELNIISMPTTEIDKIKISMPAVENSDLPNCCKNCSQRPKEGSVAICNCILPDLERNSF